jgi:hypothetical protein
MINPFALSTARRPLLLCAVLALGFASDALTAQAQTQTQTQTAPASPPTKPAAAAPNAAAAAASPLGEVTIKGVRRRPDANIPPDKRAEYDAAVAREDAFRRYRASQPPMPADAKGVTDPNALSVDYPGLHTLAPK